VTRAALALLLVARVAAADDAGADRAFHDASSRHSIDALEAIGAQRPVTRWTDDAWSEAARLAEKQGDYARALRDLEQVIAIGSDEALVRRARAEHARLAAIGGPSGEWAAVAAQHDRLVEAIQHGDPKPALRELAALVDANPSYPRAVLAMLAIARAYERDGDIDAARAWLERARAADASDHVLAEVARFDTRTGDLDGARRAIAGITDRGIVHELAAGISRAEVRRTIRWILWGLLAAIGALAIAMLRRDAGSWRAAARRLAHPPSEVWFFVPIAAVLVVVAATGNPLVSRAVRAIAITGAVFAWLSGAILDGVKPLRARRVVAHAALAAIAVIAATYLAIDRGQMLDLVVETWRSGPAPR
jgi:predicted negative regulator of RcsB-dependent stress response